MIIRTNLVNIAEKIILPAQLTIKKGKIHSIEKLEATKDSNNEIKNYTLCGFIDSHIHIESSMLVPSKFAQKAVVHGTVATVSDPHEIANVMGMEGVEFMVNDGNKVPFNFFFGAPSCVPATSFETAGATISVEDIEKLMSQPHIKYLSEMMNYPAVLARDSEVMAKIAAAQKYGKPTDGHAPGLRGEDAKNYIEAGISTDHECFTAEEALDKLNYGMKIIIREGSAAKNFDALIDLLPEHYENMMFCSDDKHPDDLIEGHINLLVKRAIKLGIDKFKVLQAACINPIEHYNLEVGQLREGDKADFIIVKDLENFEVLETYINGEKVAKNGKSFIKDVETKAINQFNVEPKKASDFKIKRNKVVGNSKENNDKITQIPVIEALDGQLITNPVFVEIDDLTNKNGNLVSNLEKDILKMAVVNRYTSDAPIAIAFIKNFGLERGAIASCVAHDSHNIVAVGVTDEDLMNAVNLVIREKGGVSATSGKGNLDNRNENQVLPLPVAGIMSLEDGELVGKKYAQIDKFAKTLMTNPKTSKKLHTPFMTLSFMALLVIPSLKLSDKGLFDGTKFEFVKGWEV
ncbi:MAG: adenine deaminase [Flexibacter sp. CG_4_10_14_3_um_filter_32_15]|nr:MAG: adenine deaminase [Flexibacter sp. CG_4_10_14_3_um_filter_32_15]